MPTHPNIDAQRLAEDTQRKATASLQCVATAELFAVSSREVGEILLDALCAHAVELGDSSIGPESKKELILALFEERWPVIVKRWEENK